MRERLRFSQHARDRMLGARLRSRDVEAVLMGGETIEEYEDGARLVLGRSSSRPLHVVVREDVDTGRFFVITVYEPEAVGFGLPDQETAVNCPLCRNGRLQAGHADTSILREGLVLVIREVPADICDNCDNCGEQFFDADVTDRLLDIADEAAQAGVFVDVRRYVAA